jgi:hypothetical protein
MTGPWKQGESRGHDPHNRDKQEAMCAGVHGAGEPEEFVSGNRPCD